MYDEEKEINQLEEDGDEFDPIGLGCQMNNMNSTIAQLMKRDEDRSRQQNQDSREGVKPVVKAILKTKNMGALRFNEIAAQCAGHKLSAA